jgi:hypothetical protein
MKEKVGVEKGSVGICLNSSGFCICYVTQNSGAVMWDFVSANYYY